ncbi:MAG: hypothetical protein AAF383_08385 [Cyanobacteria bacterium P01_A01_bin.83]
MLNASKLRQIWQIIEQTQARILLELEDLELILQLQKQLETQIFLSVSELCDVRIYIRSRIPLIRDLAEVRLALMALCPESNNKP